MGTYTGMRVTNASDLADWLVGAVSELADDDVDMRVNGTEEGFHETWFTVHDGNTGAEYQVTVKRSSGRPRKGFYCPDCYDAYGDARTDCMQHMVEAHGYDPDDADMGVGSN
jgi:hypothetical protein